MTLQLNQAGGGRAAACLYPQGLERGSRGQGPSPCLTGKEEAWVPQLLSQDRPVPCPQHMRLEVAALSPLASGTFISSLGAGGPKVLFVPDLSAVWQRRRRPPLRCSASAAPPARLPRLPGLARSSPAARHPRDSPRDTPHSEAAHRKGSPASPPPGWTQTWDFSLPGPPPPPECPAVSPPPIHGPGLGGDRVPQTQQPSCSVL